MEKPNNLLDIFKEKEYEIALPTDVSNNGPFLGAVLFQIGEVECLTVYNKDSLFFFQIVDGSVAKFSCFNIANICSMVGILKGYLLITTQNQKLWLLEIKRSEAKAEGMKNNETEGEKKLLVESFLKELNYSSYFLREVTQNMIELFITTISENKAGKAVYVYQFTVNQKIGGMGFSLDKSLKITSISKKHLYASKVFYDPLFRSILKLKSFSDNVFVQKTIANDYLFILPICKTEEYFCLNSNYELFNAETPQITRSVKKELEGYDLENGISFLNYLLIPNHKTGKVTLFSIEESLKICILGHENLKYRWQICFNGRLVGINNEKNTIKVTKELSKVGGNIPSPESLDYISEVNKKIEESEKLPQTDPNQLELKKKQEKDKNKSKSDNNESTSKKNEEPEVSKASTFKPNKILSRKDLAKKKTNNLENPAEVACVETNKSDIVHNESVNNEKVGTLNEEIKCEPHEKNTDKNENSFSNKEEKVSIVEDVLGKEEEKSTFKIEVKPKETHEPFEKKQTEKHQSVILSPKQKVTNEYSIFGTPSPFSKKDKIEGENKIFIPSVPFNEIFGKHQVEETMKQNPFQKKHESLVIEDDGKVEKTESLDDLPIRKKSFENIFIDKREMGNEAKKEQQKEIEEQNEEKTNSNLCAQEEKNKEEEVKERVEHIENKEEQKEKQENEVIGSKEISLPEICEEEKRIGESEIKSEIKREVKEQYEENSLIKEEQKVGEKNEDEEIEEGEKIEPIKTDILLESCPNYEHMKELFQNFNKTVSDLGDKTIEVSENFAKFSQNLEKQTVENLAKSEKEMIESLFEKASKSIPQTAEIAMNDYFAKKLTTKVNDYFKGVMGETKKIYDTTLKYYSDKKKESIVSLQNHFQEQEHLINEIRLITADMLTCVENTVNEGEENNSILLKDWDKVSSNLETKLDKTIENVENHIHHRSSSHRQQIIDSLAEIKEIIENQKLQQQKEIHVEANKKKQKRTDKKEVPNLKNSETPERKEKKNKKATKFRAVTREISYQMPYHGYYQPYF